MCATTEAKLGDKEVYLYMGHHGGELEIGNVSYAHEKNKHKYSEEENTDPTLIKDILSQNTKKDIIDMIIQFVDNAAEA